MCSLRAQADHRSLQESKQTRAWCCFWTALTCRHTRDTPAHTPIRTSAHGVQAVVACPAVLAVQHQSCSVVGAEGDGSGLQEAYMVASGARAHGSCIQRARPPALLLTCAAAADWLKMKCRMDVWVSLALHTPQSGQRCCQHKEVRRKV